MTELAYGLSDQKPELAKQDRGAVGINIALRPLGVVRLKGL